MGSVGFYCQEMWATDSRDRSQVGLLTFVGSVGFYCQEMWATDLETVAKSGS